MSDGQNDTERTRKSRATQKRQIVDWNFFKIPAFHISHVEIHFVNLSNNAVLPLQHLQDGHHAVRASMLVDPVTQAAVSAGISASDVAQSVVETVVSTTMPQVVDISTSGAEVSVGEAVGIQPGQVHIMEVADGTTVTSADVQAAIGEAMQTGHVTVEASDTLGITVPAEILAAMAAAQSHPHLLIATADQQLMQTQVTAAAVTAGEQQVLEAQTALQVANSITQASDLGSEVETSATGEQQQQLEQPMETE